MKPLDLSKYARLDNVPVEELVVTWINTAPGCYQTVEVSPMVRDLFNDSPALLAELKAWRELGKRLTPFLEDSGTTRRDHSQHWDEHSRLTDDVAALLPETKEKEA